MPLFLISRPARAEHLKNHAAIHGAIVEAASGQAAINSANDLAEGLNSPFDGYDTTKLAETAELEFIPALIQGSVLGEAYSGKARGK